MSPVAYRKPKRPHRIYVKVNSDFDSTGYMQPRSITWDDGRTFRIDSVKDFRPASSMGESIPGDCYTVVIRGKQSQGKEVFFWFLAPTSP
jgi:hypothetical protein